MADIQCNVLSHDTMVVAAGEKRERHEISWAGGIRGGHNLLGDLGCEHGSERRLVHARADSHGRRNHSFVVTQVMPALVRCGFKSSHVMRSTWKSEYAHVTAAGG